MEKNKMQEQQDKRTERERRDWIIILIILLIGFLCVILAGERAIRFAPTWKLGTNMRSNIDPNSDFLTSRPADYFEPLDPAILTNAVWVDLYQTPGAILPTSVIPGGTILPPTTPTFKVLPTQTSITAPASTNTGAPTVLPTNTFPYFPPSATHTPKSSPPNTPTFTRTPILSADLSIAKDDGISSYIAGGKVTYTITVINNGPNAVTGATVTDTFDTSILSNISWTCAYTGGATSTCTGSGDIADSVNLPNGAKVTYTVNANVNAGATGDLTNTANVTSSGSVNDPDTANNYDIDIDTPSLSADLSITKVDNVNSYTPGGSMTYTITASNSSGPNSVTGATVTDILPAEITSATWTCSTTGGASCTASGSGNINDTVSLPVGSSVTYMVTVTIDGAATANIDNTATVYTPSDVTDPDPGNNSATETTAPSAFFFCSISGGPPWPAIVTVPDGGCFLVRPALGVNGNIYTIKNTSATSSINLTWFGLDENVTSGICDIQIVALGPEGGLTNLAVSSFGPFTNLIIGNSSGNPVVIEITESSWSTGGCN